MTLATRRAILAAMHICAQQTELARAKKEIEREVKTTKTP